MQYSYEDVLVFEPIALFDLSNQLMIEALGGDDLDQVRVAHNKVAKWPVSATFVTCVESDDVSDPWVTYVWHLKELVSTPELIKLHCKLLE
jgi:hypothetical protein